MAGGHNTRTGIVESSLATVLPHLDAAALQGKNIFVTGGTGFFGLWLLTAVSMLNRQGAGIGLTVLSRDCERFLIAAPQWRGLSWLTFVQGNVRDFVAPAGKFDLAIHGAADTPVDTDPSVVLDDIALGTRHVLDVCVSVGVRRVLLVSSGAVYEPAACGIEHVVEEAALVIPRSTPQTYARAYREGKRVLESLGSDYQRRTGIEAVLARCFSFSGPGLPLAGHYAISNFIHDALHADAIEVKGDGTPVRSYLHGADLAVWLLHMLAAGMPGRAYNVGSDQAVSMRELALRTRDVLAPGKQVRIQGLPGVSDPARQRYLPSIQRARVELGLAPWTPLDESIRLAAQYAGAS